MIVNIALICASLLGAAKTFLEVEKMEKHNKYSDALINVTPTVFAVESITIMVAATIMVFFQVYVLLFVASVSAHVTALAYVCKMLYRCEERAAILARTWVAVGLVYMAVAISLAAIMSR